MGARRDFSIDWLRTFAVLMLFPFHTGVIFAPFSFHIKSPDTHIAYGILCALIDMWHMPLFFLLAGVGTWHALVFRTGKEYVRERFLRLFVPLVFGVLFVVPPQTYCERLQQGKFSGSFLRFYPEIFKGVYPEGNFTWNHLWFLVYLFVFSIVLLPAFQKLHPRGGGGSLSRFSGWISKGWRPFLLAVPIAAVQVALRVRWPNGRQNLVDDWANVFYYLILFYYGGLIFSDDRIAEAVRRLWKVALALGLSCVGVGLTVFLTGAEPAWSYNPARLALLGLSGFNTWFWLVFLVGWARERMNFTNGSLRYASRAALPVYVLHQTAIVVIGYHAVRWPYPHAARFFLIILLSFAVSVFVYEFLVSRWRPISRAFGMK